MSGIKRFEDLEAWKLSRTLQIYLAFDRVYWPEEEFSKLTANAIELSRVISGLIKYLKHSELSGKKYKATLN